MNFRKIRIGCIKEINKIRLIANALKAKRYVSKQVKLGNCYQGSEKEYIDIVLPFWKKYNYKPEKFWFQYFCKLQEKFDPRVIPGDLFQKEIMPYLNDLTYQATLENKIYFDKILYDLNKPKIVFKFINGFLMDGDDKFINRDDMINLLKSYDKVIIKPMDGEKGNGVQILNLSEDFEASLKEIDERLANQQFIVQEVIRQSEQLSKLNPTSVNTIRVISLLIGGRVEILSSIVRVGAKGSCVDNYHQGGDTRPIDSNGYFKGYLMKPEGFSTEDRDGNTLSKDKVLGYEKVIQEIKRVHPRFPHERWIGWDFAIDENHDPVFIELNCFAGENQREDGPSFAHVTEEFLDEFFENRFKKRYQTNDI